MVLDRALPSPTLLGRLALEQPPRMYAPKGMSPASCSSLARSSKLRRKENGASVVRRAFSVPGTETLWKAPEAGGWPYVPFPVPHAALSR